MYSLSIQRSAIKDLENLQKDYATLIGSHIDSLAQTPRPPDAKKLKGDSGFWFFWVLGVDSIMGYS